VSSEELKLALYVLMPLNIKKFPTSYVTTVAIIVTSA